MNTTTHSLAKRIVTAILAVSVASLAAACGGGGGTSASPAVPLATSSPSTQGTTGELFRFEIPSASASSAKRAPKYVSAGTATIKLALQTVNGSAPSPAVAAVTIANPSSNCGADPSNAGNTLCTVTYAIPAGTDVVEIQAFDASSNLLSQQIVSSVIANGTTNTVNVTLDANPNNAAWTITPPGGVTGAGTSASPYVLYSGGSAKAFTFVLTDASGHTITGPGSPAYSEAVSGTGVTATLSGQTLSVTPTAVGTPSITLTATPSTTSSTLTAGGDTVYFSVIAATPSPSPSPSASPTPAPSPTACAAATSNPNGLSNGGFEDSNGCATSYYAPGAPATSTPTSTGWNQCTNPAQHLPSGMVPANFGTGSSATATPHPLASITPAPGATPPVYIGVAGETLPEPSMTSPPPSQSTYITHSGNYGGLFGTFPSIPTNVSAEAFHYDGLCQTVTVPAGMSTMNFWVLGNGNNSTTSIAFDAILLNADNTWASWLYDESVKSDTAYRPVSFTLPSALAGNTYTLFVGIWSHSSGSAYTSGYYFLDDIALTQVPITASVSPVNLNGTGSANAATTTISQAGFTGTFGESDNCSAVATVSAPTSGPSSVETITGTAAGSCTATFSNGGESLQVPITVTVTNYNVNGKRK